MRARFIALSALLVAATYALPIRAGEAIETSVHSAGGAPRYVPPRGFREHRWGEPLSAFKHFELDPLYVQTAYSRGKTTLVSAECVGCELAATLRSMRQKTEGQGFHTLAEYYVAAQGVRFGDAGALLFPVFYQFCAQWRGFSGEVPADIQERMTFCGMRMLFRSQTPEQVVASENADDVVTTNYDRVLQALIEAYGEPDDYEKRGLVIIATPDAKFVQPRARRFNEWRWCSLHGDRDIAPDCEASVVLALDSTTGWGVVLYATRPVWEFAYARQHGGTGGDALYRLLTGLEQYHAIDNACTGTNLCRPGPPDPMHESTKAQFRLRQ